MFYKNTMLNHHHILKALDEISTHKAFSSSPKAKAFLTYVVKETLEGRGDALNETTIAQDVYRKRADFDPSQDSLIRVTAHRVRNMLKLYYSRQTTQSEIRITIPAGSYRPEFKRSTEAASIKDSKRNNTSASLASNPKPSGLDNKHKKRWPWVGTASMAALVIFALTLFLVKPGQLNVTVNEVTAENPPPQISQLTSNYPMIAVTPFENQTKLERFDFLETVLQKKLAEDISHFKLLNPVIHQGSTDAALANTKAPYNYVISSTILSVEPELDLLVKVIDLKTSSTIYEQHVRRSVGTSDYFDSLSNIVSELSFNSRASISMERSKIIEEQINQGTVEVSELEAFECTRLSNQALSERSSDRYKQGYTCLENLLEQDPENSTLLSHFGVLTFLGDLRGMFRARSFNPQVNADTGLELMKRAVEVDPENGTAHYFLSETYNVIGDKQAALKHAELGHIVNPASNSNLITLSRRLAGEGQWESALSLANEAIERDPKPRAVYYHTAFAWALNNNDKAELQRLANKIDELGYYYSDIFLFLAAVANEDEKTIEMLRAQVIYFANEEFDTNPNDSYTIIKWSALQGQEDFILKVRNLFAKGGVTLHTSELK